jgi:Na+/melibiose symporter-like transporter
MYACVSEKFTMVKYYGFAVAFSTFANIAISLTIFYLPQTRAELETEYQRVTRRSKNVKPFEEIWSNLQLIVLLTALASLGFTCVLLGYVSAYYKYLRERDEKKDANLPKP